MGLVGPTSPIPPPQKRERVLLTRSYNSLGQRFPIYSLGLTAVPCCAAQGDFNNPFDIFETFFGGGMGGMGGRAGSRSRPTQGDDERHDLSIAFMEAVFGAEKDIQVTRLEACGSCEGSGARPGSKPTQCSQCRGQGQVFPWYTRVRSAGGPRPGLGRNPCPPPVLPRSSPCSQVATCPRCLSPLDPTWQELSRCASMPSFLVPLFSPSGDLSVPDPLGNLPASDDVPPVPLFP